MLDITIYMYMYVHVRTLVQVLFEEANKHSGTIDFSITNHNCFIRLLVPAIVYKNLKWEYRDYIQKRQD